MAIERKLTLQDNFMRVETAFQNDLIKVETSLRHANMIFELDLVIIKAMREFRETLNDEGERKIVDGQIEKQLQRDHRDFCKKKVEETKKRIEETKKRIEELSHMK